MYYGFTSRSLRSGSYHPDGGTLRLSMSSPSEKSLPSTRASGLYFRSGSARLSG